MWYKQQSEIAIFPRVFKGIKIAYQGDYSLKFELIYEPQQGSKKSACPYIFKTQNQSIANIPTTKRINSDNQTKTNEAQTHIQNNQGYFETKSFTIKYENHIEELNDICIFKHEQKINMKAQLHLLISLQSHRKTKSKIQNSNKQTQSKIKTVFSQKIFLNRTQKQINQFLQVQLTHNDYFGTLFMYVGSVHLGWKLRNNKLTLCEFLSLDEKLKQKHKQQTQSKGFISCKSTAGKKIKQAVKDYINENNSYHEITIIKSTKEIKRILNCLLKTSENQKKKLTEPSSSYFIIIKSLQQQTQILTLQDMKQYYQCNTENILYFNIHHENNKLVYHIKSLWQKFIQIIKDTPLEKFVHLCNQDIKRQDNEWSAKSLRFISLHSDQQRSSAKINRSISCMDESMELNSPQSAHRNSMFDLIKMPNQGQDNRIFRANAQKSAQDNILDVRYSDIENFKIKREQLLGNSQINFQQDISHPYMIFQNFSQNSLGSKFRPGKNLVVFIHGLKGNQFDLQKASQYLLKYNPHANILRVSTIFPDQDQSIEEMSKTVSNEIKKHLYSDSKIESISIVGYSLGGVVGRACLSQLSQFKDKMNLFVSFSSPHLGTHQTENNLVKAGIWFLINFDKCKALQQLNTCRDLKTANKSYMKKLSQENHLKWFNKIILVSCKQDQFVPHNSSRIQQYETHTNYNNDDDEIDTNFEDKDKIKIKIKPSNKIYPNQKFKRDISQIKEMSENIRSVCKRIQRVQVWFDMENKKGTIDKLTGRQAHLQFLDNNRFLKWFFKYYGKQL